MIVIDPGSGIGMLLGLLAWLRSELGGRFSKDEILKRLASQDTVRDYLEWLRKKDQAQLLTEIEGLKGELMGQLPAIANQLSTLAGQIRSAAGDLTARIDELDARILPPALYSTPLETRVGAAITLRGREHEIEFLKNQSGDALLIGQPGSGKTFLLQEFARIAPAQFLLTNDADKAISAILVRCPSIVIIDDAWQRRELIKRLRHMRSDQRLPFRLLAVCWPFEKEEMQQTLQLTPDKILELERLTRPLIVEIIQEVASLRHLRVSDDFLRVATKQARGLPGLAVSLTTTAIDSSGQDFFSGKILLNQLGVFMQQHVGRDASVILAAFACGGARGIGVTQVARALGKNIAETKAAADRIALAGTLEQTGKDTLAVQPEFLRSALITREFFPREGAGLGWALCEQLILSSADPPSGYLELFSARASAGAEVEDELLRRIAKTLNDSRIWTKLAWLSPRNCSWVLSNTGDVTADIKRSALYHEPYEILPMMLNGASHEERALHTAPEADIRLIRDWIGQASADEAFSRRQLLFDIVIKWMSSGGEVGTAFDAFSQVFELNYETTDTDPAQLNTIRLRHGMISLGAVKQVFGLWPQFITVVRKQEKIPWSSVIEIIDKWSCAFSSFGSPLPPDYASFLSGCVKQMVSDIIPLAKGIDPVGRWILLKANSCGLELTESPVSAEFMLLFPDDHFDDDYQKWEAAQASAVQGLVNRWKDRPISDIIGQFSDWMRQAEELGGLWSQMPWIFCSKLADQRALSPAELTFVLDRLTSQYATPFVRKALEAGLNGTILERCLASDDFYRILVEPALTGQAPHLYDRISDLLPKQTGLVRVLCIRREVPDETLQRLLQHPDIHVRLETALGMFRSTTPHVIAAEHQKQWRSVIIEGLSTILVQASRDHIHDLSELLDVDPSMALEILENLFASGRKSHSLIADDLRSELVRRLNKDERKTLLPKCKGLFYSDMPQMLIGGDLDLYKQLLEDKELERFHLDPLIGDPTNPIWIARAKLALAAGYSPMDIAIATQRGGYSWTGGLSGYYQQWVDRFETLKKSGDPDLQRIAEEGLKWAIPERDAHRRSEKKEEIDG